MRSISLALLLVAFVAADANAFFGRNRGCSTGCSTSGCNVQDTSPAATGDRFTFVPAKTSTAPAGRTATKPVDNRQTSIPGPIGPAGPQGPAGEPGKDGVTPAQMDYIVQQVTASLLPQMKNDPTFRGAAGMDGVAGKNGKDAEPLDINAVAAAVIPKLPPITMNFMGPNGVIAHTQTARLGETLSLPPIVLNGRNQDGSLATATKAIGEALTVTFNRSE